MRMKEKHFFVPKNIVFGVLVFVVVCCVLLLCIIDPDTHPMINTNTNPNQNPMINTNPNPIFLTLY